MSPLARRALPALALLLVAACQKRGPTYRQYVDSFIGKSQAELIAAWGQPLISFPSENGGTVMRFLQDMRDERFSGRFNCETSFVLDSGGIVRSASYSIRLYGEQLAFELAKGWVHLHQWFFSTSLAHEGDRGWAFTAEVLAEYREPAALTRLYGDTSARGRQRIDALRRLRPLRAP